MLFDVLGHFFDDLARGNLEQAAELFPTSPLTNIFTPRERDDYNRSGDKISFLGRKKHLPVFFTVGKFVR